MLIISGRAYKRNFIFSITLLLLVVVFVLSPLENRAFMPVVARTPYEVWLLAALHFLPHVFATLLAANIVSLALMLRRPFLTADTYGIRLQTGPLGTTEQIGWHEISRADIAVVKGPDVLWKGSSQWNWRTLYIRAADPAYFSRQGWRGQLFRLLAGGAAFAISEQIVGPQFDELAALVNARTQQPA